MRFFLISIFFALIFSSCALGFTKDLIKVSSKDRTYKNNYFSNTSKDYVYKAQIEVYGKDLGGIIIIKKIKNQHHRIVFTTEFGSKIFDFELIDTKFKINFILDELDKKLITKTLQNDFMLLLRENSNVFVQYKKNNYTIYQTKNKNRYNYYFENKTTHLLEKIAQTSKTKEKLIIIFEDYSNEMIKNIQLMHKNIKLKIKLKSIVE